MRTVGIRELKNNTSQILREVVETGAEVLITHHGKPIARFLPFTHNNSNDEHLRGIFTDVNSLAAEIGAQWPQGVDAVAAVNEQRRES